MKKHYTNVLQLVLLTLFMGTSYGQNVDETSGSGSSIAPANAVSATVQIWGAGGAGGGSTTRNRGGAGGGGGAYSTRTFTVAPGQTITYSVGSIANGDNGSGANGGNSTIIHTNSGTNMAANGGQGGGGNNGSIGSGGTATGGTTNTPGQNGIAGGSPGGKGGNGAGPGGGNGGAGYNNGNGGSGNNIGGGGGGGRTTSFFSNRSGGNGANGRVVITYTIVLTPTISSYTPYPVCSGETVTLTGTNFTGATSVRFNGVNATSYNVVNTTQITAVVPVATSGPITVTTPGGTATSGSITINSLSTAPTGITVSGGNTTICAGNPITLTRSGGSLGTGATVEWFSGNCGGVGSVSLGSGNTINPTPLATTTYYLRYTGTCNTTTCASVTITVENLVTGGLISGDATACQGDTKTYTVTGMSNQTSYLWTVPTGATIISGSLTNSITVSYSPTATVGLDAVTVTGSNTCGDHTVTLPVTVNTAPTISLSSAAGTDSQTLCINTPITPITYAIGGGATSATLSGTLPAGVNSSFSAGVFTISGTPTSSGPFNFTVTTTGGACGTVDLSGTIQVDAEPTLTLTSVASSSNQILCILTPIANITYTVGGAADDASATGLPAGVAGSYASGVFTISGSPTVAGPFNYTVTTSGSSCTPATITGTMTVNPLPDPAGTISGPAAVCQGETGVTYTVPAIANATDYNWTLPPLATIVGASNTNSIVVNYNIASTSGNVTVEGSNACGVGVSSTLPVTVNITPYIPNNYSVDVCSGEEAIFTPANGGGNIVPPGTSYSWGLPSVTGGITGATVETGQTNFNQTLVNPTNIAQTASYSVTATTAGCSASTFTLIVTVYPKPEGAASPATQTICANSPISTINFSETTGISGTIDYSWTRDNLSVGGSIATSGNGTSISGNLTNTTNTAQTTIFTVIATSEYGCDSEPFTVSVTVNPTPTVAASSTTQTICSDDTITPILLTNPNGVTGTTFSWTRTNDSNITGIPNGNGTSITGALTNTTNTPHTTEFTITASANGCPSSTTTVSVTVNPKPTVAVNLPTQAVCGGDPISDIVISNPNTVSGVTYSWTRTDGTVLAGLTNGTGSTISGTINNPSNINLTAIFTITATSGTCSTETTASVLVKPTPLIVATPLTQTICNNTSASIALSITNTSILGAAYSWTRIDNPDVTELGPGNGTGSGNITNTLQNNTTIPQDVTYIITVTRQGCSSTTTATVTVNPPLEEPIISDNQAVCLLARPTKLNIDNLAELGGSGTYTYQWQRSDDGVGGWTNIGGANADSYQPPTIPLFGAQNYYYRVRTINSCGTVFSNPVFIQVISNAGFDFNVDDDLNGAICPGETFLPSLESVHASSSAVRYSWTADSNFITDATGGPIGTTGGSFFFGLFRTSIGNIGPLTVKNNTNATVTTELEITPAVYEYAGNNPGPSDFICSISPQYINVTIRPTPVATPTLANNTICSGDSPGIEIFGNITDADMQFIWFRDTPTGITGTPAGGTSANIAPGTAFPIPGTLTNTSAVTREVTYTITPRSNGCLGTSIEVKVNVAPNVTPGAIEAEQVVCTNGDPVIFTETTPATGLNLGYQWQISTTSATTGFTDIIGATNETYDAPGPLTETTWYRRIAISTVNGVSCSSAATTAIRVRVNTINPGTITGDQTVCSPGDPVTFTNSAHATGGIGTRSYQWQMNTVGCGEPDGSWTNVGGNSATYNPPAGLLVTTYYRRLAQYATSSCFEASNCITVYVNDVTGGTVAADQSICGTNPDPFTESTASTGTGALTYQWQSSTTSNSGPWANISGATLITYDAPAVPGVTTTTYYKRVTFSTLNGEACPADSNVLTVTPSDLTAGQITGNITVCYGEIPAPFGVVTPAIGSGLSYQWQSSATGGIPWTDIVGATSATYTFTSGITTTTYFRRVVTSGIGCTAISNFSTVFVNNISASTIVGNQTVCNTQNPDAFTVATAATGTGTLSYQWQSSTVSATGPWTNINLETGATYNPPVLSQTTYYQVVITSTLNGIPCTTESNPIEITVEPFVAAVAGNLTPINNCNDTEITLSGNGTGTWTAVTTTPGALFSFSSTTDPNATFTGESGSNYNITWTIDNPSSCADDSVTFAANFPACLNDIDFNGTNNYTNFKDKFDFTTDFSIELWLKRNTNAATKQTLFSKRDANDLSKGYDLSLENGQLTFNWDASGSIQATQTLNNSRWFHVAVTHIAGTYKLYIDGIEVTTGTGSRPTPNTVNALLGATGKTIGVPQDYYNGSVDELRIWNTGLTEGQIREMMNQEIESNGTAVRGSELQLNIAGLDWSDLAGYYQMNQGTSDVTAGQLADNSGLSNAGTLTNMVSNQLESAPLPYTTSGNNTNWDAPTTWTNGGVQQTPNSLGIDGIIFIDWNIVRTGHNVTATNKDVTVLGLLVDAGRLTIRNTDPIDGQSIEVTRYLNINNGAILDLVGESQLLQKTDESILGNGTGILERDQQGTGNMFNYNYWGSPVSTGGTVGARTYDLRTIINDGSDPVTWVPPSTFIPTTSPISISTRWLYTYKGDADDYDVWKKINPDTPIDVGVGFLMKGGGLNTAPDKNYTFKGRPNNGTILVPIGGPKQAIVIGNPYPSAINAFEFIVDNDSVLLDGTLQFWQQSPNASTHVYAQYQGGYGYLTLSGGVPPASPPDIAGIGGATTEPEQYIPVGQGFYVNASTSGGNITFKNSHREFAKESDGESVFLRTSESKSNTVQSRSSYLKDIQRMRLAFKTPEGAIRNLLLAFTPNNAATDGIDYGFDGLNGDEFPSDLLFAIEGKKFVIQGVGAFDINKKYPLDMTLGIPGNVELALTELENFEEPIDVYVHDAVLDTYTKINEVSYQMDMKPGNYPDRFSIVFRPDETLSIIDQDFKDISVKYLQKTDEIYVKTPASIEVRQIYLINMAGQSVRSWNMTNMNFSQEFKIPVKDVSEGNYILQVESGTNSYNKKVIIKF
ncbi:PKD-like domain-containing protein [Gelidibacter mesophilus]|uniref:PKD-like domain-containing protein n=1 Tax=Gelidibacter mesophilus TaxID=169050 RepID=UPI000488AC89|nr:PKD-like domain-containing protein [Gelidibacter mesophilus]